MISSLESELSDEEEAVEVAVLSVAVFPAGVLVLVTVTTPPAFAADVVETPPFAQNELYQEEIVL